jgi:hypothetical protein
MIAAETNEDDDYLRDDPNLIPTPSYWRRSKQKARRIARTTTDR